MNSTDKNEKLSVNQILPTNPSKIEYYIEYIFDKFSKILRLIGPVFAFALTVFISIVTHAFFNVILPYYVRQFGILLGMILILIALFILFNLLFNYFMAVLVKPGSINDLKTSKYYRNHDPLEINQDIVDLESVFKNSLNKIAAKLLELQKNLFELKMKNLNTNNEEIINMTDDSIKSVSTDEIKLLNKSDKNYLLEEDSIDEMTKNFDEKIGCLPKINENELLNNNFNQNEINLLNLNDNTNDNTINNFTNNQNIETNEENIKIISNNNKNVKLENSTFSATSTQLTPQITNCKHCKSQKIIRSHHCQICGICVLKMDHHCPWINNCVGHYNHRYFVLFLTWLMFGCIFVSIFSLPILFLSKLKKSDEFNFISVLCLAGMIIMFFFNSWNWFLVIRGNTTIEFWSLKSGIKTEGKIKDFSLPYWRDNLFLVFGTRSMVQAVCCASKRRLPVSGVEWTKLAVPMFKLDCVIGKEDDFVEEFGIVDNVSIV